MSKRLLVLASFLALLFLTACSSATYTYNDITPKTNFSNNLLITVRPFKGDASYREVVVSPKDEKAILVEPLQYNLNDTYELILGPVRKVEATEEITVKLQFDSSHWSFLRIFDGNGNLLGNVTFYSQNEPAYYDNAIQAQEKSAPFVISVQRRSD